MPANNIRLLSKQELIKLKSIYYFEYEHDTDPYVVVRLYKSKRMTKHRIDQSFFINSRVRKMSFTPQAMLIWRDLLLKGRAQSLIDVQQAVNYLTLTSQPVSNENVLKTIIYGCEIKNA